MGPGKAWGGRLAVEFEVSRGVAKPVAEEFRASSLATILERLTKRRLAFALIGQQIPRKLLTKKGVFIWRLEMHSTVGAVFRLSEKLEFKSLAGEPGFEPGLTESECFNTY